MRIAILFLVLSGCAVSTSGTASPETYNFSGTVRYGRSGSTKSYRSIHDRWSISATKLVFPQASGDCEVPINRQGVTALVECDSRHIVLPTTIPTAHEGFVSLDVLVRNCTTPRSCETTQEWIELDPEER